MKMKIFYLGRTELALLMGLLYEVRGFTKDNMGWVENNSLAFNCLGLDKQVVLRGLADGAHTLDLSFKNITCLQRSDFAHHALYVTKLNLSHNHIDKIYNTTFAGFLGLKELGLSSNDLCAITAGMFLGLRNLKLLDLRNNHLSWLPRFAFEGLVRLHTLWLQNNTLNVVPEVIRGLRHLRVLSLANNQISRVNSTSLQGLDLTALHLEHNLISEVTTEAFQGLVSLKILNISSNLLETVPVSAIKPLWELGTDVHLHGNPWRCDCELLEFVGQAPGWVRDQVQCQSSGLHTLPLTPPNPDQQGRGVPLRISQTAAVKLLTDRSLTLPCGSSSRRGKVLYWQTPFGRYSRPGNWDTLVTLQDGSLKIPKATTHHTGLYYCHLWDNEGQGIFPYRVQYAPVGHADGARLRRSRGAPAYEGAVSRRHFGAAVTAAVMVTFLVGFSLGAFSRTHLNRCFQRLRPRADGCETNTDTQTLQEHVAFQTSIGPDSEDTSSVQILPQRKATPPVKAPRKSQVRQETRESPHRVTIEDPIGDPPGFYLEGSHNGESREESEEASIKSGDGAESNGASGEKRPQEGREPMEQSGGETDPSAEPRVGASKRRVIKLYNYDEDGNHYSHVKECDGKPAVKQRSLSLTRLNTIMSSATGTDFSKTPGQGQAAEPGNHGDSAAVFQFSI